MCHCFFTQPAHYKHPEAFWSNQSGVKMFCMDFVTIKLLKAIGGEHQKYLYMEALLRCKYAEIILLKYIFCLDNILSKNVEK